VSKKIAITGSTGFIGSALSAWFEKQGDVVIPCVRESAKEGFDRPVIRWNAARHDIDFENLEGCDVMIHLAGANITARPWSSEYKREIMESRVQGTRLIAQALAKLKQKPQVFLSASAIGYYGSSLTDTPLPEATPPGNDFLADVCVRWEKETEIAAASGIRVVNLRVGVVLGAGGGALEKMLPVFRSGIGGVLGTGNQMMSWIALDDIRRVVDFIIGDASLEGPVNVVSPQPVSNREFTKTLARVLKRPALLPVPAFALRLMMGEMADSILLNGSSVVPDKLLNAGFQFAFPSLESALKHCLSK
jgi:uncharacterized protein